MYKISGAVVGVSMLVWAGMAHAVNYELTIYDSLGMQGQAMAVNNKGNIAGVGLALQEGTTGLNCNPAGEYRAKPFLIKNGQLSIIATQEQRQCLKQNLNKIVMNEHDVVAGNLNVRAYRYQNGIFESLHESMPTPSYGYYDGSAIFDINDHGHMVGFAEDYLTFRWDAVYYNGSSFSMIKSGESYLTWYAAEKINNSGKIFVREDISGGISESKLYMGNRTLAPLAGFHQYIAGEEPVIYALNNNGYTVGWQRQLGAFIHDGTSPRSLGRYDGYLVIYPTAINDSNQIVGYFSTPPDFFVDREYFALIHENGEWVDLNTKVTMPPGWRLIWAEDISNNGIIVGTASYERAYNVEEMYPFKLTPVVGYSRAYPTVHYRGTTNNFEAKPMTLVANNLWQIDVTNYGSLNPRFKFDVHGDWSLSFGDSNSDNVADQGAPDIKFMQGIGDYRITFNDVTKQYSVTKLPVGSTDVRRTVVFIYGQTVSGQDMFIRGGIDWGYAKANLGRDCGATPEAKWLCAIPIAHNLMATNPQRANDTYLDWYGVQPGQGAGVEGSPLVWTTNAWPTSWGAKKSVAANGYGEDPENTWGHHYWKLDVLIDCNKTVNGWFELKSYISNGPGWESNVSQPGAPYTSINHFARCGYINKFARGVSAAELTQLK